MILTPHFHWGECMPERNLIQTNFEMLQTVVKKEIPDMNLFWAMKLWHVTTW